MLGAIAGDIIGSVYEWDNIKTKQFPLFRPESRFTDDTVLTVAIADAILNQVDYTASLKQYHQWFPNAGYGRTFKDWAGSSRREPYNSWGNGSAMRVSPVGYAFDNLEQVLQEAKHSAEVTHNHPEGIKGAQATAAAIFLARTEQSKSEIKTYIESHIALMYPARVPFHKQSRHFWNQLILRTQFAMPFLWGVTVTRSPVLQAVLQKLFMVVYQTRSREKPWLASTND